MSSERKRHLVVAAACTHDGKILLTKRRPDQPMGQLWELPGGKMETGESPEEALAREIREELDVEVRIGRIVDVVFHRYSDFDLLMLVYGCSLRGEPKTKLVDELRWLTAAEAAQLPTLPADKAIFARWAEEGLP